MTTDEKSNIQLLRDLRVCGANSGCYGCSRIDDNSACERIQDDAADAIEQLIKMNGNFEVPVDPEDEKVIQVNHPAHYNREGAMECIDEMAAIFGVEWVMIFCLLNVWKYRYRAADKGGTQDMEKSDDYMRKYLELKKSCTRGDKAIATGAIEVSEARNGGGEV